MTSLGPFTLSDKAREQQPSSTLAIESRLSILCSARGVRTLSMPWRRCTRSSRSRRGRALNVCPSVFGLLVGLGVLPSLELTRNGIPKEAATIPLVTTTAALSLYKNQDLPPPWSPRTSSSPPVPLIVYGASSALGSFAIKLAKLSNIHPIIAICGGTVHYVSSLIDPPKGDIIPDYRPGVTIMKSAIRSALGHLRVYHALDAISSKGTWIPISQLLAPGDQLSVVSGANKYDEAEIPEGVEIKYTYVGTVHSGAHVAKMPKQPANTEDVQSAPDFAFVLFSYLGMALTRGTFEGHPYKIVPGGLAGVGEGLRELKEGKNKGDKLVYRVTDTTRE